MLGFWTLALLFLALAAAGPWWPFSRGFGFTPAAFVLALLLAWLAVVWIGWLPFAWPWTAALRAPDLP
jgi:hypothetical protein